MMLRATLVAAFAATLLPLTGTSQASCLDDAAAGLTAGYGGNTPRSPHYPAGYVQRTGTATVVVYGDDLASDSVIVAGDVARWSRVIAGNAPGVATTFVDCVAG